MCFERSVTHPQRFILFFLKYSGKYITEADVEDRVRQMESTRNDMMERLEYEAKNRQRMLKKKL